MYLPRQTSGLLFVSCRAEALPRELLPPERFLRGVILLISCTLLLANSFLIFPRLLLLLLSSSLPLPLRLQCALETADLPLDLLPHFLRGRRDGFLFVDVFSMRKSPRMPLFASRKSLSKLPLS